MARASVIQDAGFIALLQQFSTSQTLTKSPKPLLLPRSNSNCQSGKQKSGDLWLVCADCNSMMKCRWVALKATFTIGSNVGSSLFRSRCSLGQVAFRKLLKVLSLLIAKFGRTKRYLQLRGKEGTIRYVRQQQRPTSRRRFGVVQIVGR